MGILENLAGYTINYKYTQIGFQFQVSLIQSCNQSGSKGKGLWRKRFAEEPDLEFRMKH